MARPPKADEYEFLSSSFIWSTTVRQSSDGWWDEFFIVWWRDESSSSHFFRAGTFFLYSRAAAFHVFLPIGAGAGSSAILHVTRWWSPYHVVDDATVS